jgi:16S rRNA (uracil1498-N3)-methyltransferase
VIPRIFVRQPCVPGEEIALDRADAHHIVTVLRMQALDPIILVDGKGAWDATLIVVAADEARVRVLGLAVESGGELPISIIVLQAVARGSRFDQVVEKVTELGAARIVPVRCDRAQADAGSGRVQRWRRIARSAAEQSRRQRVPEIEETADWRDAIARIGATMPVIVAWQHAPRESLTDAAGRCMGVSSIAIAVGPESGFSDDEIAFAREVGVTFVSLGPTILRTETAAAALIAALAARCGWW